MTDPNSIHCLHFGSMQEGNRHSKICGTYNHLVMKKRILPTSVEPYFSLLNWIVIPV